MVRFVDLSHVFEDGMPGIRMPGPDGASVELTARIRPFMTHAQSQANYRGKAAFGLTEISFHTSIGTYLDSPHVRWPERRDIGALAIEELVLPGVALDLTRATPDRPAQPADIESTVAAGHDLAGSAVLCRFGWDRFWGQEAYRRYPFLSREALRWLIARGARLVGVDTVNIDDSADLERPAHSWLLERDIFIVENLRNLAALPQAGFRFFAVPIRARGAVSMPIRAFAELP